MDIFRSKIRNLILPKFKSVYITDYFERIYSAIKGRPEIADKDLLANPRVRTHTEIIWASDRFSHEPKPLSKLSERERTLYAEILRRDLNDLLNVIEKMEREEGGEEMAELLIRALEYIDEDYVLCGEGNIAIVNWGVIPRDTGGLGQPAIIMRAGRLQGQWAHPLEVTLPEDDAQSGITDHQYQSVSAPEIETPESAPEIETRDSAPEKESDQNTEAVTSTTPEENDAEICSAKEEVAKSDKSLTESAVNKNAESAKAPVAEDRTPGLPDVYKDTDTKKSAEPGLGKAFGVIFRKLWPWMAGLVAIVLLLFLCRDYQGRPNQLNPFYDPLPSVPRILPVYEGKVAKSIDGSYTVCSDRLNILFDEVEGQTFHQWATEFKKAYPGKGYKVVYFNPTLKTMQVVVPPDQRVRVLEEIKDKVGMKGFDVFEERVYDVDFHPSDPAMSAADKKWYLDAIYAEEAWDVTMGSEDVVVAVIDNGFDLTHPELAGKVIMPYNAVEDNMNIHPITTKSGKNAHGTHVAATAVGNADNGAGLLGIAPKCRLMPIQVGYDNPEGHLSGTAIMHGFLYAVENGADVINLSLGTPAHKPFIDLPENMQLTYIANNGLLEESIWHGLLENAAAKGCIVVFSAGNDHCVSGLDPKKRCQSSILVSAVNPEFQKASFSNYGRYPELDLDYSTVSAPGVNIYNAAPDGGYKFSNGTSMAAPVVSGAAALLKSINRNFSVDDVRKILQSTGKEVSPKIGPVIDLGRAVHAAKRLPHAQRDPAEPPDEDVKDPQEPEQDCEAVAREIDRLEKQLADLKKICPGPSERDTLKYRDAVENPENLNGLWKTTTKLYDRDSNNPIELYIEIKGKQGKLLIFCHKKRYTAPLEVNVNDKKITFTQNEPAYCTDPEVKDHFIPYAYVCSEDRKGNLKCVATNKDKDRVEFNLVRSKK